MIAILTRLCQYNDCLYPFVLVSDSSPIQNLSKICAPLNQKSISSKNYNKSR